MQTNKMLPSVSLFLWVFIPTSIIGLWFLTSFPDAQVLRPLALLVTIIFLFFQGKDKKKGVKKEKKEE